MAQRKKKSARERGYQTIEEVAAGLRSLAAQLVQDNKGRLAKVSLNIWYEEDDEAESLTELQRAIIEHDDDMARLDRNTQSAAGGSGE
jgi:hypothetical protein